MVFVNHVMLSHARSVLTCCTSSVYSSCQPCHVKSSLPSTNLLYKFCMVLVKHVMQSHAILVLTCCTSSVWFLSNMLWSASQATPTMSALDCIALMMLGTQSLVPAMQRTQTFQKRLYQSYSKPTTYIKCLCDHFSSYSLEDEFDLYKRQESLLKNLN